MRTPRRWFQNSTLDDAITSDSDFNFLGEEVPEGHGNVISSLVDRGRMNLVDGGEMHVPILDLDEVGAVLVPSSTPGNFHLYLDNVFLTREQYEALLVALYDAGIVKGGILKQFRERGATFARPPWIHKPQKPSDEEPF